jgi:hypothetical protein
MQILSVNLERKLQKILRLTNSNRLDSDPFLLMGTLGLLNNLVVENIRLAEGVHEGRPPSARCTYSTRVSDSNATRTRGAHTNYHYGELNTLDLVPSSSSNGHFEELSGFGDERPAWYGEEARVSYELGFCSSFK